MRCASRSTLDELTAIRGVDHAETLKDGRYRLIFAAMPLRRRWWQAPTQLQWGLHELIPEQQSLEDLFIELTQHEEADAMIWVIARREFGAMFLAPLAWVILAVIQIILGYMFLTNLDNFSCLQPQLMQLENTPGVTDIVITPLMQVAAIILLMVMPLLTMRSIAEEKRNRSLTLLISAPLSMSEIVLGKFLGLMLFVLVLVSMLMLMPLSLYLGTTPDRRQAAVDLSRHAAAARRLQRDRPLPVQPHREPDHRRGRQLRYPADAVDRRLAQRVGRQRPVAAGLPVAAATSSVDSWKACSTAAMSPTTCC